jgi:hypothetical protein
MNTPKLLPLILLLALFSSSPAATLSLSYTFQGVETVNSITNTARLGYTTLPGSFSRNETIDQSDAGYVAHAYAALVSDVSLSGATLSISGSGSCDASVTYQPGSNTYVRAASDIIVRFTIDSPFYFSVQADLTQSEILPQQSGQDDQTFVALATGPNFSDVVFLYGDANATGLGPFSGSSSGWLTPGTYEFQARSDFQSAFGPPNSYADHSRVDTFFTVSDVPEPSTTLFCFAGIAVLLTKRKCKQNAA